jgi:glucose/mannose-6-phosphate isomerase
VRIATAGPPRSPGHCSVGVGPVDIPLGVDVPHARSALGALCAAPLAVIERLGLARDIDVELDHAVAQLHHRRARSIGTGTGIGTDTDVATLARRIGRLFPLVYGEGPVGGLAALRWKQQCNTNAKSPAFAAALPDLAADEIAGWGQHGDVTRQVFCGIVLRHDHELAGGDARFAALDAVLDESLAAVHEWRAAGDGPLAQLLDLAYAGDLLSLHLAAQEGLDPGPAPALDLLRY